MAEREDIVKEKLESNTIFDYPALYMFAHNFWKGKEYGVDEEKYAEKVSGNVRDINIEWKANRRFSDYFKVEHKMKFEIEKLTDVEVEIDGNKKKMNKGKIVMDIKAVLVKDWDSKWDPSPMTRFLRDVYNKYIIPSRIQAMRDKAEDDAKEFKEQLKSFLELYGRK